MSDQPASKGPLPEFTIEQFDRFRTLLQEKCGMFFDENKMSVLRNMVQERMLFHGLNSYDNYFRLLNDTSQTSTLLEDPKQAPTGSRALSREMRRLVEALAVNETSFFRNREHYRAISEEVLPRILRRRANERQLRIWSAGCSTGQEPYSLAMTVLEVFKQVGRNPKEWKIEILATDISERALKIAHTGRYRSEEMRGLSPEYLAEYFRPLSAPTVATAPLDPSEIYKPGSLNFARHRPRTAYEVSPSIRELVKFQFFNLATPTYPVDRFHNFDMVLCENVTIYFTPDVTRRVISNLYDSMNDGGFLFIGYSETLWQISDRFKLINTHDTFYYQKPFPNEDPSRYVRRQPTTGPLQAPVSGITDPLRRTTDDLAGRGQASQANLPVRTRRTDPLPPDLKPSPAPAKPSTSGSRGSQPLGGRLQPGSYMLTGPQAGEKLRQPAGENDGKKSEDVRWQDLLSQGRQKMHEHEFDQAHSLLEQALSIAPGEVDVLSTLSELELKLGHYATATELCQRAIRLDPLSEAAHLMLAMIHHKEGRIEQAIQEYKHTIYINLNSVIAHMRLADIYRDTGHQRDALREYRHALTVLQQKAPDEIIEDLSVGLLIQACQQNITRLSPRAGR